MNLIQRTKNQINSPIDEIYLLAKEYNGTKSIIDATQGAVNYEPAIEIIEHVKQIANDPDINKYCPRRGLEELRHLLADNLSTEYETKILPEQILITAGCNQAFCIAISSIADYMDEVIITSPYYFNHKMWIELDRIIPIFLNTAPTFYPNPKEAEKLISKKTKAIILVSPNNPTGISIPPDVISEFGQLAKKHQIILILDETYRAFRYEKTPAHNIFSQKNWNEYFISLYSFSKEYAIPGYRVGAIIGHPDLLTEMMKIFDCISICAPRIGQEAAIAALKYAKDWKNTKILEMQEKNKLIKSMFTEMPGGFEIASIGAFYAWVKYSWPNVSCTNIVRQLLFNQGILALPGSIFSQNEKNYLRFSFSNLSESDIYELGNRLSNFYPGNDK